MTSDQTNQILKTLYSSIKTKEIPHVSANIEKLEDIILDEIYQVSKLILFLCLGRRLSRSNPKMY